MLLGPQLRKHPKRQPESGLVAVVRGGRQLVLEARGPVLDGSVPERTEVHAAHAPITSDLALGQRSPPYPRIGFAPVATVLLVRHGLTAMTGPVLAGWTPGVHLDG